MNSVRQATMADVPALVDLVRAMHAESRYRGISYSAPKMHALFEGIVGGGGCVFVYERAGVLVGLLAGAVGDLHFSGEKMAFDYFFFVHPAHRGGFGAVRMVRAFIAWAKAQDVAMIDLGISSGVGTERTGALYESLGLTRVGTLYSTLRPADVVPGDSK